MLYCLVKGCPQGGILSPLLFAIYYNEVGSALLNAKFKLFADDLVFYIFNSNTRELVMDAETILAALNSWCSTQDLTINFSKTQYIIFHKAQNKLEDDLPQIICGGEIIERVNEFKYLGVYFDSHFTFQRHYEYVLAKTKIF